MSEFMCLCLAVLALPFEYVAATERTRRGISRQMSQDHTFSMSVMNEKEKCVSDERHHSIDGISEVNHNTREPVNEDHDHQETRTN